VAANILVTFTADSDSLDASVKQATKDIASIGDKAAQAGAKASESFKEAGKSAAAAFSSGQVKAAIDGQIKSIDSLKQGIDKLYKEEIKLLSAGQKQSAAYKKNVEEAAKLRAEIDKLSKGTNVYGNETGKVEKAAVSLKTQLKNLKAELSNLEAQGQENSKAFQDTAFQAARLEDQIGDTNERVRVLASDTFKFDAAVGAIKGLAAGFSIAQGAVAIFGEENKDLQKVIAQTQGAIALLTGLQEAAALVTGQGATKIAFQNIFMKEKVVVTTAAATATGVLATAEEGAAVATLTTVRSLNLLKLAIAGTGIGLLVIALVELYKIYERNQEAVKKYNATLAEQEKLNREVIATLIDEANARKDVNDKILVATGELKQEIADKNKLERDAAAALTKTLSAEFLQKSKLLAQQIEINAKIEKNKEIIADVANNFSIAGIASKKYAEAELATLEKTRTATTKALTDVDANILKLKASTTQTVQQSKQLIDIEAAKEAADKLSDLRNKQEEERKDNEKRFRDFAKAQFTEALKFEVTVNDSLLAVQKARRDKELQFIKDFNIKKTTLDLTTEEEILNRRATFLKAEEAIGQGGLENRENIILTEAAARVAAVRETVGFTTDAENQITIINAEAQAAITQQTKDENQKRINSVLEYVQAIGSAFASINDLSRQLSENRIADITATSEAELKAINDSTDTERQKDRERAALAKRTAAAIAVEKTKQAKQDKALALFNIAVSTAQAIIGFLANPGGAKGVALSIIAGVTGAAQLAAVAAKPIPKFERGGVIGGQRHSQGGTMIEAERDEYIVNRGQSVKHRQELNAMNTSSAAFKKLIDERYVRPAVMSYMMQDKRRSDGVTVNAKLDSRSMESELRSINKNLKKRPMVINVNSNDSRYQWQ
jgi:hypothetical protein